MFVTNEILNAFINCKYKAYRKSNNHLGNVSEYQLLYNKLKLTQKSIFEETLPKNKLFNLKFTNCNIDLVLDGIEHIGKKNIAPIFITPFEKIAKSDKLFLALQATFIQNEFNYHVVYCKVVSGKNLKPTKFKLSSFAKIIAKLTAELKKILSSTNAPIFFKNTHCQICEFKDTCLEKLIERDDLSLLAGLKPKEILQKNNRGIFSVRQLSYSFRPQKNPYRKRKFLPELKALAIRESKTYIKEIPDLKQSQTEVFLDFEGIIDRNSNYLIGIIVRTNHTVKEYSFWADQENDQAKIFLELINILKQQNDLVIYHYGSYEIQALKRALKTLPSDYHDFMRIIIDKSVDLLYVFTHHIYPPTYSNGLKEIARFLKFHWTEKEASGLQSTLWRYQWELNGGDEFKHKLMQYNLEDCRALIIVKDWIGRIGKNDMDVQLTINMKPENIFKWGVTDYIVKDFDEINSRAYFDYQRNHIFLRTDKKVYKAVKKQKHSIGIYNKPDKKVDLSPVICPHCNGKDLATIKKSKKVQVDLAFMNQGIKKQAIEYTGGLFQCVNCRKIFHGGPIKRLPTYGYNLMLWSVNQKIQYRQSSENVINFLKDSFKISVSPTQMTKFKEIIAQKYIYSYQEIIAEITTSKLIHTDETIARIKGIDGYVWVFANYDSVFYQFRETRETEFLKELMKGFSGVLVSDFYTGYDFLECKQQKCLVHLIRDLNEDFLKNQLDTELKMIVIEFGSLLRSIVTTIDKFGLKKVHLNKHKKDVEKFYAKVILIKFESEFALSYQKRFVKYKTKLFYFLEDDNIPWNNNNAEHSIKPFAKWRKKISKSLTRMNLENHLILLSVLQTCKYRGINFFEFLKSGETSISKFLIKTK